MCPTKTTLLTSKKMCPVADFKVETKSSEVVMAASVQNSDDKYLPLSNLDLLLPPVDVGVFLCYSKPACSGGSGFHSLVAVLKNALAEALSHYYAFAAGKIVVVDGSPELLCNNRGVDFFLAFADVELRELDFYNPDQTIEGKLVPDKKHGVLSVQVTELKCGGVVVGCKFDHRVADAYSANMFLLSWTEMGLSKPLSNTPTFRRSLLRPRCPGHYHPSIDDMYVPISSLPSLPKDQESVENNNCAISRIFYVRAHQIYKLQILAAHSDMLNERRRTKFEAFCAFLWKLVANVCKVDDDKSYCKMGIVVDGRMRLGDDENNYDLENYFGNVLSIPFGEKRSKEVRESPLNHVAEAVHEFLSVATTKEHFQGLIDWVEAHQREPAVAKIYSGGGEGPSFVVSSGRSFPGERMDFGWGKPVFASYHFPWGGKSGYIMPMPSPKQNGDWIVYMHMLEQHLNIIENQAAHVFQRLTYDYLCH